MSTQADQDALPQEPSLTADSGDLALAAEAPEEDGMADDESSWYLGLDIGTTAIAAVLFNRQTGQRYPLVWNETNDLSVRSQQTRLPAIAYITADQLTDEPEPPAALANQALLQDGTELAEPQADSAPHAKGLLLRHFKACLNWAVPYRSPQSRQLEPLIQWSDHQTVALGWLQAAIAALLKALQPTADAVALSCAAVGLSTARFQHVMGHLHSIIVSVPAGWSEAYHFNLREAVLTANLIDHPAQIIVLEESVAALLEALYRSQPPLPQATWETPPLTLEPGFTLVLTAGAVATELLLVELPTQPQTLERGDLLSRSMAYGGNAIDQDIICHLLYPAVRGWQELNLAELDLPLAGEVDPVARDRLQQRLESTALGRGMLDIVRQVKPILAQQDELSFSLNDQSWTLRHHDWQRRIVLPYLQQIGREVNVLLAHHHLSSDRIRQVIYAGGTTHISAISRWLRHKFPHATLHGLAPSADSVSNDIAYGLAVLPNYPWALDAVRHQYSDWFLLRELLRILPPEALPLWQILRLLDNQGINTTACHATILHLLEGELPSGLVPDFRELPRLIHRSLPAANWTDGLTKPLFRRHQQTYQVDPDQRDRMWRYLNTLCASTRQSLQDPLTVHLQAPGE